MTDFTCEVEEEYRSACEELPFYAEREGKRYCVLHYPGDKNDDDLKEVLKDQLRRKHYDFSGTVFTESTSVFEDFEFDAYTSFAGATFVKAAFSNAKFADSADFSRARFRGEWTTFSGAKFSGWTFFSDAEFSSEWMTTFGSAEFSARTYFSGAKFTGKTDSVVSSQTDFTRAKFDGDWTFFSKAEFSSDRTDFKEAVFGGELTDFEEAKFNGVWTTAFQEAVFGSKFTSFSGAKFSSKFTSFSGAKFSGESTDFLRAEFSSDQTKFEEAVFGDEVTDFSEAKFSGETVFRRAKFSGEWTSFSGAEFGGLKTSFAGVEFGSTETYFIEATFTEGVHFSGATFKEKVAFWGSKENAVFGSEAWAWFDHCRIDKPDLLTFDTVLLRSGWFINTDVRKVDFTDVKWYGLPGGPQGKLEDELEALQALKVHSRYTLIAQVCRRLSANAEENREYPLANEFHYWSMDALRKESWEYLMRIRKNWLRVQRRCGLATTLRWVWRAVSRRRLSRPRRRFGLINTFYWALSGYGVRAARASWVLVGICTAFAALYMVFGPDKLQGLGQAVVYSLGAVARLNPEPRPTDPGLFQLLVIVEGLLGPLQIALLALAIRRKVMR